MKKWSFVQVNLCQKLLFLHQLTHNMMTDCSLNYKFNTIQNNFCTQYVLPMFCKKKSFWQRFTCMYYVVHIDTVRKSRNITGQNRFKIFLICDANNAKFNLSSISTTYQKICDLSCPVHIFGFRTVWVHLFFCNTVYSLLTMQHNQCTMVCVG